jgi:hypothetical protein
MILLKVLNGSEKLTLVYNRHDSVERKLLPAPALAPLLADSLSQQTARK